MRKYRNHIENNRFTVLTSTLLDYVLVNLNTSITVSVHLIQAGVSSPHSLIIIINLVGWIFITEISAFCHLWY